MEYVVLVMLVCWLYQYQAVSGEGVMLIYRPRDISNECAQSRLLRFDLSFGMGMSDTITLVFRTLNEVDYECTVEIVTNDGIFLLVVIRFPNKVADICHLNKNALKLLRKKKCVPLCSFIDNQSAQTPYFKAVVMQRLRFRFAANSSINANLNAHVYQVTITAARAIPEGAHCQDKNETLCIMKNKRFCFTSGVVCDGIKNCGAADWYDERKSGCGLPIEQLSGTAVVAIIATICLSVLAVSHFIARCLPPLANSFFIFNANEDNRLCLDPMLKPPELTHTELPTSKRISLIPVFLSSSDEDDLENDPEQPESENVQFDLSEQQKQRMTLMATSGLDRKNTTIQNVTAKIKEKFRAVTGRGESSGLRSEPQSQTHSQLQLDTML